jgi:hypothetical protein
LWNVNPQSSFLIALITEIICSNVCMLIIICQISNQRSNCFTATSEFRYSEKKKKIWLYFSTVSRMFKFSNEMKMWAKTGHLIKLYDFTQIRFQPPSTPQVTKLGFISSSVYGLTNPLPPFFTSILLSEHNILLWLAKLITSARHQHNGMDSIKPFYDPTPVCQSTSQSDY